MVDIPITTSEGFTEVISKVKKSKVRGEAQLLERLTRNQWMTVSRELFP